MGMFISTPDSFDARTGAEMCRVHDVIYQQGACSACLAFAASAVLGYRSCINSNIDYLPSPYRLFDCLANNCDEGLTMIKVETARIRGIGDINGTPHQFGWGCRYLDEEHPVSEWVSYAAHGKDSMKVDLYYHGPAVAHIYVDPLFYGFRGGYNVYPLRHIDTIPEEKVHSLHAVVVIGWGLEPEPHWVIQNSWGHHWGDNGVGKVAMHSISSHYGWKNDPYSLSDNVLVATWLSVGVVSLLAALLNAKTVTTGGQ